MIKHQFVSAVPDGPDPTLLRPSNWNEDHVFDGGANGALLVRDTLDDSGADWLEDIIAGSVLLSGGVNAPPVWGKVNLTSHVTGVLPQANMDLSGIVLSTRTVNGHALSADVTVTKSDVGLGSVENTALSTWAGSTSITTTGVIGTGTWSGLFGAVSGANLTNLTAANIAAGTAGINISGNAATATSATTAGSASTATLAASATVLATPRAIYGNDFDGSAALTQIIASGFGGTGNGFTKFSGPTTSEKTFTLPNASATILTDSATVTAAQGGTGIASYAVGDLLYASGATTLSKLADVAVGSVLVSGGVTTAPAWSATPTLTSLTLGTLTFSGGQSLVGTSADVTTLSRSTNNQRFVLGLASALYPALNRSTTGISMSLGDGSAGGFFTAPTLNATTSLVTPLVTGLAQINTDATNTLAIRRPDGTTAANITAHAYIGDSGSSISLASGQTITAPAVRQLKVQRDATFGFILNFETAGTVFIKSEGDADTATVKANTIQATGNVISSNLFYTGGTGGRLRMTDGDGLFALLNTAEDKSVRLSVATTNGTLQVLSGSGADTATVKAKTHQASAGAFSTVPASPVEGQICAVTDSTTATPGATITGGGSNHVLGYYNGTAWKVIV